MKGIEMLAEIIIKKAIDEGHLSSEWGDWEWKNLPNKISLFDPKDEVSRKPLAVCRKPLAVCRDLRANFTPKNPPLAPVETGMEPEPEATLSDDSVSSIFTDVPFRAAERCETMSVLSRQISDLDFGASRAASEIIPSRQRRPPPPTSDRQKFSVSPSRWPSLPKVPPQRSRVSQGSRRSLRETLNPTSAATAAVSGFNGGRVQYGRGGKHPSVYRGAKVKAKAQTCE